MREGSTPAFPQLCRRSSIPRSTAACSTSLQKAPAASPQQALALGAAASSHLEVDALTLLQFLDLTSSGTSGALLI